MKTKNQTTTNNKKSTNKSLLFFALSLTVGITAAFSPDGSKLVSRAGHISFFSHTDMEDISAENYKVVSTIDPASGTVVFSVPMQAFEFKKALMQKHFNSAKFLDTKTYPKSKFKGRISNLNEIDFTKDGSYPASVKGELELHGVSKSITEKGTIIIKGGKVVIDASMKITLADYNISFENGKPSTNIAKTVDIHIKAEHEQQK